VRISEWIVLAYAGYLVIAAFARPVRPASRMTLLKGALSLAAVVVVMAWVPPAWPAARLTRDFAPVAYLLACYKLSGLLFFAPQPGVEARFARFDARVQRAFGMPESVARAPRSLAEFLEASYFACYLALPAGLVVLMASGRWGDADRFWALVLLATLACYGMLPWIRTRAPWALEPRGPMDRRVVTMRSLNWWVSRNASIQVNTFPSAHTAAALAVALAVARASPAAGALFLFIALSIAVATFVGRYHYAGDSLAALATTLLAWAATSIAW
jgi:hypothetical protein